MSLRTYVRLLIRCGGRPARCQPSSSEDWSSINGKFLVVVVIVRWNNCSVNIWRYHLFYRMYNTKLNSSKCTSSPPPFEGDNVTILSLPVSRIGEQSEAQSMNLTRWKWKRNLPTNKLHGSCYLYTKCLIYWLNLTCKEEKIIHLY